VSGDVNMADPAIRDAVLKEHKKGIGPKKLAAKYGIPLGTVKSWIQRHKAASKKTKDAAKKTKQDASKDAPRILREDAEEQKPTQKKRGAPYGNKNAVGNKGGPGGPPGNKKAVFTHEYESIVFEALPKKIRKALSRVETDKLVQLREEIMLAEYRESEMLKRIEQLKQSSHTMTQYKEEVKGTAEPASEGEEEEAAAVPTVVTERKYEGTLGQIQRVEEALTRMQAHKANLIRLYIKIEELELKRQEIALKNW
jgi:uncharacterized protein YjcR